MTNEFKKKHFLNLQQVGKYHRIMGNGMISNTPLIKTVILLSVSQYWIFQWEIEYHLFLLIRWQSEQQ